MYMYIDENGYVYGWGNVFEEGSVEIDVIPEYIDEHLGCYKFINGEFVADTDRIAWLEQMWAYERELFELEEWFKWYDEQAVKFQRYQRLELETDIDIATLDAQALLNAQRITEIRNAMAVPFAVDKVDDDR